MYEQIEKPKENKSRAIANSVARTKSNVAQSFGFVDNRFETVAQRKIQALAYNPSSQPILKKEKNARLQESPKSGQEYDSGVQQFTNNASIIQRMILPLGDLDELQRRWMVTDENREGGKTISSAVNDYKKSSGDQVARPWDKKSKSYNLFGAARGAFFNLGLKKNEAIRIYGHGETEEDGNEALQIGGYNPNQLVDTLINMELPKDYNGEVYLTGCLTAVGKDDGFLGKFYSLLIKHAPNAKVRGNLGTTVTFSDGSQGVWNGIIKRVEYDKEIHTIHEKINQEIKNTLERQGINGTLQIELNELIAIDSSIKEQKKTNLGKPDPKLDEEEKDLDIRIKDFSRRRKENDAILSGIEVEMASLENDKLKLVSKAHTVGPTHTVLLP